MFHDSLQGAHWDLEIFYPGAEKDLDSARSFGRRPRLTLLTIAAYDREREIFV